MHFGTGEHAGGIAKLYLIALFLTINTQKKMFFHDRAYRRLWVMRINAATRIYGMPYSLFIGQLKWSNILLNRYVAITMFQTKSKILLRIFLNLKLQECYIGVGHVRAIDVPISN